MDIILRKKKTGKSGPGKDFPPGNYWNIVREGKRRPIGFVGYVGGQDQVKQVVVFVEPRYRGKGVAAKAEDILADKLGFRFWDAVIGIDNTASRRAHEKAGWQRIAEVYTKSYEPGGEAIQDGED